MMPSLVHRDGKQLMKAAAPDLKKLLLELGDTPHGGLQNAQLDRAVAMA